MWRLFVVITTVVLAWGGCDRKVAGGSLDGGKIFAEVCARCHGPGGEPNNSMIARYGVKNLRSDNVQRELTDGQIRAQIVHGSANKQMPAFDGAISEEQITAVIGFIRSLGEPAKPVEPTP